MRAEYISDLDFIVIGKFESIGNASFNFFLYILSIEILTTLLALSHSHNRDLLHKWSLLQVCYRL